MNSGGPLGGAMVAVHYEGMEEGRLDRRAFRTTSADGRFTLLCETRPRGGWRNCMASLRSGARIVAVGTLPDWAARPRPPAQEALARGHHRAAAGAVLRPAPERPQPDAITHRTWPRRIGSPQGCSYGDTTTYPSRIAACKQKPRAASAAR